MEGLGLLGNVDFSFPSKPIWSARRGAMFSPTIILKSRFNSKGSRLTPTVRKARLFIFLS